MKKHEKVFKNEDGSQIKVMVSLYEGSGQSMGYNFSVQQRARGKRLWRSLISVDSYHYRRLSLEDREKCKFDEYMRIVGADRIHETAHELWEKIKPQIGVNLLTHYF